MAKRISKDIKQSLVDLVRGEIEAHQKNISNRFSANSELAQKFNLTQDWVIRHLSKNLSEEEKKYRTRILLGGKAPKDLARMCYDYVFFDDSTNEISQNYDIAYTNVATLIRKGIKLCYIAERQYLQACKRKRSDAVKGDKNGNFGKPKSEEWKRAVSNQMMGERNHSFGKPLSEETKRKLSIKNRGKKISEETKKKIRKLSDDRVEELCIDYVHTTIPRDEIAEKYGVHFNSMAWFVRRGIEKGFVSEEQYRAAESRRRSERIFSDKTRRKLSEANLRGGHGLKLSALLRKTRYSFNSNFYDSQSEATVATLLEKYVPEFKVEEGKNFQVNHEIPKSIDFLVDGEFLEWHPILMFAGKGNLGDMPSQEKYQKFKKIKSEMEPERAKVFERRYKRILAANYLAQRQSAVNESQNYRGISVSLVQTPEELYQFLARRGYNLPDQGQFTQEFKQVKDQVKKAINKKIA